MSDSIRNKAIQGTLWSFIERFSVQLVQFFITIIMARILTPSDYGLIGMLAVFMSLSQVFIDGGFSSALIQRKDVSLIDYSTVFYINVGISFIIYGILYVIAPQISDFFGQQILTPILRVYSLTLVINSMAAVQKTILTIRIDFKTQSKISLLSAILSGIAGIIFAYTGFGVWALVFQTIIQSVLTVIFTLIFVRWRPMIAFSKKSFKTLFAFGSNLLIATIISVVYDNLYNIVIGKKFSSADLGYYSRARQFPDLISMNISGILSRVSYPILSQVQNDDDRLRNIYKKYIQVSSFIIFPLLMLLAGLAKPIILVLLTDKWIETVPLLRILCFGVLWQAITHINLSLLKVKGRSDLVLKLEVVKKTIAISILVISLLFNNLNAICYGIVIYGIIGVVINTYYTNQILNYGIFKQVKDFGPYLVISIFVMIESYFVSFSISNPYTGLILGITIGIISYLSMVYLLKLSAISEIKEILYHFSSKLKRQ